MAKKSDNRGPVEMRCSECKAYLRPTSKNKKNTADRLELKKFCPTCGKHTIVKEKK